jgi:predicted amidohydrolase YtcJ
MDTAIGNTVRMARVSLPEALEMATTSAARAGRIAGRQRGLEPGEKADLVFFSWDEHLHRLQVQETVVSGQVGYQAQEHSGSRAHRVI